MSEVEVPAATEVTETMAVSSLKKTEKKAENSGHREISWGGTRGIVLKAMKAMKAVNELSARSAAEIAEKAGLTVQQVKHNCYKDNQMVTEGYSGIAQLEGSRCIAYYLTKKGLEVGK